MAGSSPQHGREAEWFTAPRAVSQRRYEALRAYFVDGLTYEQAGARFGYTRWAMVDLARQYRAGKLELFAAPKKPGPPPGSAPAKERVRGRVIELRRQGHSTYEISRRLAAEDTPLNRTSVGEILAEEGFGRLLRRQEPEAGFRPAAAGRDTTQPRVLDFAAWPQRLDTTRAGLLLAIPDLVSLDLPALAGAAGYPGTRVVPAVNWLLSLLALTLTRTRRVCGVDDLLTDPAAALFAGMAVLPGTTALTNYSHRLSRSHQQRFLTALNKQMINHGLASAREPVFYLDKRSLPCRARSVPAFFAHDTGTHNLVYANADITRATLAREPIAFCDHWKAVSGSGPKMLIMDQKVTTQEVLGELDARGVKFAALRRLSHSLATYISGLAPADFATVTLDAHNRAKVHENPAVKLTSYPGTVRQLVVTGLGREEPTVIITNDGHIKTSVLVAQYARRKTIGSWLAEIVRSFCTDALASTVNLGFDLDVVLAVLAQALTAALRARLPGYATATPGAIQRRVLETPGQITTGTGTITVRLERRAFTPVLRGGQLPADTPVPWWGGRTLRYELA